MIYEDPIYELLDWMRQRPDPLGELAGTYAVEVTPCEVLGVVVLNYSQYNSPMDSPLVQACRALILEPGTWRVVSRSFSKFFNHGEPHAPAIDWTTARVYHKLDGSLICLYHHRGEWQIATRGTADASGPVGNSSRTFADLVRRALGGETWLSFSWWLDPRVFYSFELTAPENRVVVPYAERRLTLLAAWNRETLEEIPLDGVQGVRAPKVETVSCRDINSLLEMCQSAAPFEREGYVVRDGAGRRVKVKTPAYVFASNALSHLLTDRRKLECILAGKVDDYWPYLPDEIRSEFTALQRALDDLRHDTMRQYREIAWIADQKAFAAEATRWRWPAALFSLRKGLAFEEIASRTQIDKLLALIGGRS